MPVHMRLVTTFSLLWILAAPLAVAAEQFDPAARAAAVAPFIDEQTFAVGHVDVTRLDIDPLISQGKRQAPSWAAELDRVRIASSTLQAKLREAGFRDLYLVMSLADLPRDIPYFVVPLPGGAAERRLPPDVVPGMKAQLFGSAWVIARPRTMRRLPHLQTDRRPHLAAAFEAAGDSDLQLLLLPTDTDRRVIEEMQPRLPAEVGGGPVTILTRGLNWATLGLELPPQPRARIVVQSLDDAAARQLRDKLAEASQQLGSQESIRKAVPKIEGILERFVPRLEASRLVIQLDESTLSLLLAGLSAPLQQGGEQIHRKQTSDALKQLGLAMHNFYDVRKRLPAIGTFDERGKPLLSWRVHLLPYLEQGALYKEFHLDQPWDSPHNRSLIARMPAIFLSPGSKLAREQGRSTFRLPAGADTAFPARRGITFREITDGTSNTIMIVEVADDHAEVWTKPAEFVIAPDKPDKGLGGQVAEGYQVTLCDGSVIFLEHGADPKIVYAMFTRAGREVIDWKSLRR